MAATESQNPSTTSECKEEDEDDIDDSIAEPYPFKTDLKCGAPLHYLTFFLKYFAPAECIHDYNLKKMVECELSEKIKNLSAGGKNSSVHTVLTGSIAEGLAVPEYMLKGKFTQVVSRDRDEMISDKNTYHMDLPLEYAEYMQGDLFEVESLEDSPSSYAYVNLTEKYRKACALSGKPKSQIRIPSALVQENSKDVWNTVIDKNKLFSIELHGPATTAVQNNPSFQDVDHVRAIAFSDWPDVAAKWMIRSRLSEWPDAVVRLEVVQAGYHMVPVGRHNSPKVDLEWRYSFSVAEKILAQSINKVQRQVYVIMKLLHSYYFEFPGVFPSFYLKTLYFWILEKVPQGHFQENNIGKLILYVLDEVCLALSQKCIYHYFIPEVNLLKNTPRDHCRVLLNKVKYLQNNLVSCLLQIEDKIEFLDFKRPKSKHLFYMAISSYKKRPGDYDIFLKSIRDGLTELIESYLLLMKGYENFPDEYKLERETKWNLFTELCSQAALDLYHHFEMEFPSELHFFIYTFAKFRNRSNVVAKLVLSVCDKVNMSKKIATDALVDMLEYCSSTGDKVRSANLTEIQKILESLEMPSTDTTDNGKLYAKSSQESMMPLLLQNVGGFSNIKVL